MLLGDYYTYEMKSQQSDCSPHCRVCASQTTKRHDSISESESICHILVICEAYRDIRNNILSQMHALCEQSVSGVNFSEVMKHPQALCQFLLDPSSMNLFARISMQDPQLESFFKLTRQLCYSINEKRLTLLRSLEK